MKSIMMNDCKCAKLPVRDGWCKKCNGTVAVLHCMLGRELCGLCCQMERIEAAEARRLLTKVRRELGITGAATKAEREAALRHARRGLREAAGLPTEREGELVG